MTMTKQTLKTVEHPRLNCLCRSDGAVRVMRNRYNEWTFGWSDGQYLRVTIDGRRYRVHRLIAEAFLGSCPKGCEVDHIDRNKFNNHVDNLRYATRSQNVRNTERVIHKKGVDKSAIKNYNQLYYIKNRERLLKKAKERNARRLCIWNI